MDEANINSDGSVEGILAELREALERLDQMNVPADIGAHLSLVIDRLERFVGDYPHHSRDPSE